MNTTQWAMNEIAAEYTNRVHMVINFIYLDRTNRVSSLQHTYLETSEWESIVSRERIIVLACSLNEV